MALNAFAISSLAVKGMEMGFKGASEFLSTIPTRYAKNYNMRNTDTGQTIEIVLPPRPNPWIEGRAVDTQGTDEERVSLTVRQFNTSRMISDAELQVSDKEFMEDYVKIDINGGVRQAETQCLIDILSNPAMANTGSVGQRPASSQVWQETAAMARQMLVPNSGKDRICALLDEITMAKLANNEATLFRPATLVDSAALEGRVQELAGVAKMYGSPNIATHTNGSGNTTGVLVNGAGQSGNSLVCDAATFSSTFTEGSQFILELNALDPEKTQIVQTFPQVFTLTQDAVADGAGNVTLVFAPAIIVSGSLKNVETAPANNGTVVFLGNLNKKYRQNILYSPESCAFVGLPLPALEGQGGVVKLGTYNSVPIRAVHYTNYDEGLNKLRYDIFFGIAVKRWEWIWRIWDLEVAA